MRRDRACIETLTVLLCCTEPVVHCCSSLLRIALVSLCVMFNRHSPKIWESFPKMKPLINWHEAIRVLRRRKANDEGLSERELMEALLTTIEYCGDYHAQLCALQALLFLPHVEKHRHMILPGMFADKPKTVKAFESLLPDDTDLNRVIARSLLNTFNEEVNSPRVVSIELLTARWNDKWMKPPAGEYLWLDINKGSGSLSLYVQGGMFDSSVETLLSLSLEDMVNVAVIHYCLYGEAQMFELVVKLKSTAELCVGLNEECKAVLMKTFSQFWEELPVEQIGMAYLLCPVNVMPCGQDDQEDSGLGTPEMLNLDSSIAPQAPQPEQKWEQTSLCANLIVPTQENNEEGKTYTIDNDSDRLEAVKKEAKDSVGCEVVSTKKKLSSVKKRGKRQKVEDGERQKMQTEKGFRNVEHGAPDSTTKPLPRGRRRFPNLPPRSIRTRSFRQVDCAEEHEQLVDTLSNPQQSPVLVLDQFDTNSNSKGEMALKVLNSGRQIDTIEINQGCITPPPKLDQVQDSALTAGEVFSTIPIECQSETCHPLSLPILSERGSMPSVQDDDHPHTNLVPPTSPVMCSSQRRRLTMPLGVTPRTYRGMRPLPIPSAPTDSSKWRPIGLRSEVQFEPCGPTLDGNCTQQVPEAKDCEKVDISKLVNKENQSTSFKGEVNTSNTLQSVPSFGLNFSSDEGTVGEHSLSSLSDYQHSVWKEVIEDQKSGMCTDASAPILLEELHSVLSCSKEPVVSESSPAFTPEITEVQQPHDDLKLTSKNKTESSLNVCIKQEMPAEGGIVCSSHVTDYYHEQLKTAESLLALQTQELVSFDSSSHACSESADAHK